MTRNTRTALAALLLGVALPGWAHDTARDAAERTHGLFRPGVSAAREAVGHAPGDSRPPLYDGIGRMGMAISTADPTVQAYFDQGLAFAWAFNHGEARRAFREAQRRDPRCAMCFWGEAWVLGANLNAPMDPEAEAPARAAIRRAMDLRDRAGEREQALIAALARRYAPGADPAVREAEWARAMKRVADTWPDDLNLLVLKAEALMNLQAWDYWEADRVTPKGNGAEIVATLEKALAMDPDHPGAIHFYIHAVEASATPERAEPYADRLRGATPSLGHLVHMPAHIYMRVGRHADLMAVNRDAAAADEALFARSGEPPSAIYRFGYYPHNVHFLLIGAMNTGLASDALDAATKLDAVLSEDVMRRLAWTQAIKTAPYAAHATFSDADTVLALPAPPATLPLVVGYWRYARGEVLAREGRVAEAEAELAALDAHVGTADFSAMEAQFLPARDILGVAHHVLAARIGQARGDLAEAERHLREAVALQEDLPYMEPPYWHYPVRQTLGAVLLQQGRAEAAAAAFAEAVAESPRNGWALWGLGEARAAVGDRAGAATARAAFGKAWLGDPALLAIPRL